MIILTTVAKKSDATRLAKILIQKSLAACVTTLPQGESRYIWKGKVCVDKEYVLLIKTSARVFTRLKKALEKDHPYDCPEIVGVRCDKISKPYGDWIKSLVQA